MILNTSVDGLVTSVNKRLEDILRAEIERQMLEMAKPIIKEAAITIGRNLRGMVVEQRNYLRDEIILLVKIDGVEVDTTREGK